LPGYRFGDRLGQGLLGEYWRVADDSGMRLAQFLPGDLGDERAEDRLLRRWKTLDHPALPPRDVFRNSEGRLVLVSDLPGQSLRELYQEHVAQGKPGIPRAELLGYLSSAARALDELHRQSGLPHLGVCPRNVLVQDAQVWLLEFGLVPLLWLPLGRKPGEVNNRYTPPESTEQTGPADSYSLALIYAEMLTGLHPGTGRPRRRSSGRAARREPALSNSPTP